MCWGLRLVTEEMTMWLLLNSTDPAQELQWLIYELQNAEDKGEKVHILGHIPPGHSDCLKVWSHNYYTIVNRYEATITAQFFGHTHFDEFELFYDENNRHRVVTDHETWVMNLEEANRYGHPRWYQLYSARRAYNMRNLLPEEWNRLVYKMALDDNLFRKYQRFYWKNSVAREDCDSECKKRMLCDLKSGRSNDRKHTCAKITEQVEIQERTGWTDWIYSGFSITSLAVVIPVAAVVIPNVLYFFFF
ncbi:Sphingomyelin phosphodiesterase [Portunus trituberculatus]|uniref:Sphingomyelin phosphodiesterase n=1 Tax=Portunus trituberculatus TaxID=210409 RepID=A0A5B7E102_PORTR|nr:Sphingomyelin phosphodiesterase [Portunus trituberculatus]